MAASQSFPVELPPAAAHLCDCLAGDLLSIFMLARRFEGLTPSR